MALSDDLQLHRRLPARHPHHPGDPRGQPRPPDGPQPRSPRGALGLTGPRHPDPRRPDPDAPTLGLVDPAPAVEPLPGAGAAAAEGSGPSRWAGGFVVRTDGAARGNPGPASSGAALIALDREDRYDPRARPDATVSEYLGIKTNNVAEYVGVLRAVTLAAELGARRVELLLDSNLIVEQLHGRWRVKDAKLQPLWADVLRTLRGFPGGWSARHVPRAQNTLADALANEAIDRAQAGGPAVVVRRPS